MECCRNWMEHLNEAKTEWLAELLWTYWSNQNLDQTSNLLEQEPDQDETDAANLKPTDQEIVRPWGIAKCIVWVSDGSEHPTPSH